MDKTYLIHHGIKGQRWGIRRYQNEDGSLTSEGRKRYDVNADGSVRMKPEYIKKQYVRGTAKAAVGLGIAAKATHIGVSARKNKVSFSSKLGKKSLNQAIFGVALGSVVVGMAAKNFVNASKNRKFNTVGMGPTPETFTGKPKTRAQVLAANKKQKSSGR